MSRRRNFDETAVSRKLCAAKIQNEKKKDFRKRYLRSRFLMFMGSCGRRSRRTAGGRGRSNEDIIIVENGRVRNTGWLPPVPGARGPRWPPANDVAAPAVERAPRQLLLLLLLLLIFPRDWARGRSRRRVDASTVFFRNAEIKIHSSHVFGYIDIKTCNL